MELDRYVAELQRQLAGGAAMLGEEQQVLADRLASALDPAVRMVLLDALSSAAGEISRELAPGAVDLRLRGRDPEFVVTPAPVEVSEPAEPAPAPSAPSGDGDDGSSSRTTLRLPDQLKSRAEELAALDGISLNTWLVRTVQAAVDERARRPKPPREGRGDRVTGWVR